MQLFELVFSPTGGTRRAADLLAGELPGAALLVDLTDPAQAFGSVRIDAQDLALIAVPAYGGRVPAAAAERLRAVQGNGARAVLVAVYGNRAFEDTLVELEDLARQAGFRVAAAVAAVAEHSIDRATAAGRPDAQDAAELAEFGRRIAAKLTAGGGAPRLPGNRPYKPAGARGPVPAPTEACIRCGLCAARCPVQAIDPQNPGRINREACLHCMRCAAICPRQARQADAAVLDGIHAMLCRTAAGRKENELSL